MSVTFSVAKDSDIDMPEYPGFGASEEEHEAFDASMEAYWEAKQKAGFVELNVSNSNARWILSEIFGLVEDELWGSMSHTEFNQKLYSGAWKAHHGVVEPSVDQAVQITLNGVSVGPTIIDMGRSREQIDNYIKTLNAIGKSAEKFGVDIVWG